MTLALRSPQGAGDALKPAEGEALIDRLVYSSRAEGVSPQIALETIFRVSVPKNASLKITGALGFTGGSYIQLLEGPRSSIDDLLRTLQGDPRHAQLRVLLRGTTRSRLLPSWSMARLDLARATPDVEALLNAEDGLGLTALMAALAHEGVTV